MCLPKVARMLDLHKDMIRAEGRVFPDILHIDERSEDERRCAMKAGIFFTGTGPILLLTSYEALDDPNLIENSKQRVSASISPMKSRRRR